MRKRFTKSARNIRATRAIKSRRSINASSLGNFTNDDFKRLMEQICDNIVEDYEFDGDPEDAIYDALWGQIDSECAYYADCFNIIWGSDVIDWSDADRNISSIVELAAWIIESEFYNEGYYDDVYDRITNGADEDEEYE